MKRRTAKGKYSNAISTRDGHEYPYTEMVRDPVSKQWVHYSEVDKDFYENGRENPRKAVEDVIALDHPLPPRYDGQNILDPYTYGVAELNVEVGQLEVEYSRHIQHPEDHFYLWNQLSGNVPNNIDTDDPSVDLGAMDADDLDGNHLVTFSVPNRAPNSSRYVLAYHHSRHQPSFWAQGTGEQMQYNLNQIHSFIRGNDVVIYGDTYHTIISPALKVTAFTDADDNTIFLGV